MDSTDLTKEVLLAERKLWEEQRKELEKRVSSVEQHANNLHDLWAASMCEVDRLKSDNTQLYEANAKLCDRINRLWCDRIFFEERANAAEANRAEHTMDFRQAYLDQLERSDELEKQLKEALKQKKLAEEAWERQSKRDRAFIEEVENRIRSSKGR
ncbi:hypothetical protein SLS58_007194 [Diplodia intermedia]|uniref:Flagellar FliJ protein n=1 Tax=Diplodia intermedia TaxID=856260 RepID=A0ABR3TL44_9PEZI